MIPYLYLIVAMLGSASSSILGAYYNRKNVDKTRKSSIYCFLSTITVFCFWCVSFAFDRAFEIAVIPYAILFSVCYFISTVGIIKALEYGSTLLTSLMLQISGLSTAVWAFIFWGEPLTWLVALGLTLVIVAIALCLYNGKNKEEKNNNQFFKWLFYVSITFIGNGACGIIQRSQQMAFNGQYGNFLMMTAMGMVLVACAIWFVKDYNADTKTIVKGSWQYPLSAGLFNGILNLIMILLVSSTLSTSVIYPALAIGSLMITTLFSCFAFKEKMRWWQWLGVVVGIIAVTILS
jgi:drug/metabolite transporter (DMT)-like permease